MLTDETPPVPTPRQLRALRGYHGWSQKEAAEALAIYYSTVRDFELSQRQSSRATLAMIGLAMQRLGVIFDGKSIILPP
jgi:transcriptional regulator with XRE-family HTH domain